MIRIGIVGAESTHSTFFTKLINVDKCCPGFSVDYIWGETKESAAKISVEGRCPNIVDEPCDMIGKIDAVIIAKRNAKEHISCAMPFIKSGIPIFIDKPLCYCSQAGRDMLSEAEKAGIAISSFSIMPFQKSYKDFVRELNNCENIASITFTGPADYNSPHGGIYFYGIHQIEMMLNLCGYEVLAVQSMLSDNQLSSHFRYNGGRIVGINFVPSGLDKFTVSFTADGQAKLYEIIFDESPYLQALREICTMFKMNRWLLSREQLLKPVLILEAIEKSIASNKIEILTQ